MIAAIITFALTHRWLALSLAAIVAVVGVYAYAQLPIDAYPDISGIMVQLNVAYPGRAPEEVERQVTIPLEIALRSVPRVDVIRSRTIFGLSVIQLEFEEGVDLYWARQRVVENYNDVKLPENAAVELGSLGTPAGELYRYELTTDGSQSVMDLRELNDWVVLPRLLRAKGVAEVTIFGGEAKEFVVRFVPAQLDRFGLSLTQVVDAIRSNNASAGGSVFNRGSMSYVIRSSGTVEGAHEIENIYVKTVNGAPIYVRDVAAVAIGAHVPSGIYSKDRLDHSVEGIVTMRRGENPSLVLASVREAVDELNESGLPAGARIVPFYDRDTLVNNTLHTVAHSVLLGITLVMLVLLLLLGRPSMALLVAITIPFSLLFALVLMYLTSIPIGLLSIGAIDFGIIVDGAIIMAENIARRLGEARASGAVIDVRNVVRKAALEVERAVFFSVLMIVAAFLPLMSLTKIEGLLFRPMALTMVFALVGALLFAMLLVPVLATLFYRKGYQEPHNPVLDFLQWGYARLLQGLLAVRWLTLAVVCCVAAFIIVRIAPRLGVEFLPYVDEGTLWVKANFPEGTSLQQTQLFGAELRAIVRDFPDVEHVSVQSGRNDSNTDPFPPSRLEMMLVPRPRAEWTQFRTKAELIAALRARFHDEFPTTRFNFTQPIIDNVTEETNGTSANLAVELSGGDTATLVQLAEKTVALLKSVPGSADVGIEQEGPQPQLLISPDRALCARYNVRIEDVTKLINTALGGEPIGTLYEGERRFDIVVKLDPQYANSRHAIGLIPVSNTDGQPIPLSQVASLRVTDGQTIIARENGRRRITVRCDIVGRDQGGFVQEAQERFASDVRPLLPAGVRASWIGMFENLQHARNHFAFVLPIAVVIIFVLLLVTFGSPKAALLLLLSVPFAFLGAVVALYWRGMNLNVSTGVGFAALFGVSIMNGVLLVRSITALRQDGMDLRHAIIQGGRDCLRPIILASLVAILGLLPASLATGLGSDVQRPLATVIVWGLCSATILTLFVVPVLYYVLAPKVTPTAATA